MKQITRLLALAPFCMGAFLMHTASGEVEILFHLEMDGSIQGDGMTYSGDSGYVPVPVFVGEDEFGLLPDFDSAPGTMYMDSTSTDGFAADEVLLVDMGSGNTLFRSYMMEAIVKPNSATFADSGNNWHNTQILNWWKIGDWCDVAGTVTDSFNLFMRADNPLWTRMSGGSFGVIYNQVEMNPSNAIALDEWSHVAIVWTWSEASQQGKFEYYLNGALKVVGGSVTTPNGGALPDLIGIGNNSFSAMVDPDQLACGADINFNGGFSGWFDAVALSTFTGDFNGDPEFVLLEGDGDETWAGYPIVGDGDVDTDSWMGWLNVLEAPWIWSYSMDGWIYMEESGVTSGGSWGYVSK